MTQDELKIMLHYDPDTGLFKWKKRAGTRGVIGSVAGSFDRQGYILISLNSKKYRASRLAFLYMDGSIPKVVDHINNLRFDNRWCNLRCASIGENNRNCRVRKDNTSGIKGVSWHKTNKRWNAQIAINGKVIHLGTFPDSESAENAVRKAREELHGEFANHG